MNLQASLLRQLENPDLTLNARAELRCQVAKEYEEKGDYEAARQAMGELWQRIGERPKIEGLEKSTAAEALLRAGVLSSFIGSCNQIEAAQEIAKNLISESLAIFESLCYPKKIAEAQTELALCYWHTGAFDEARILLQGVLAQLTTNSELRALAILRSAIVERGAGHHRGALKILAESAQLFEKINNHVLKGSYHNQLALAFRNLSTKENKEEYLDRAFLEYEAASFHFEEAGHKRYLANVENNLGFLFYKVGKYKEAHRHLDYARRLATNLRDRMHAARVDETRARVLMAEGRNADAEKAVSAAIRALEEGGQHALLAEALITHGKALARLSHQEHARFTLQRAIEIAEQAGAKNLAGEAALTIIQELGGIPEGESQSPKLPLGKELRRYEHELIKRALIRTEGHISRAAQLLGTSHQHLGYIIEHRHKDLIKARKPKKDRAKRKHRAALSGKTISSKPTRKH
jgi:tetratricopeptide (TPR) repeat protein